VKKATMKTVRGDIHIELFDVDAPNTVKNFIDWQTFSYGNILNRFACLNHKFKQQPMYKILT